MMNEGAILRADHAPVNQEFLNMWCLQFRHVLVKSWPGLVGLIIDGGIQDLGLSALNACQRRGNYSCEFLDAEVARWVRLEFPEYSIEILRRGALTPEQEEDLDLVLGIS